MRNITDEWKLYRKACYPKGVSDTQNKEVSQAFFAGVLCSLSIMNDLSELPEEEAVKELKKLADDAKSAMDHRLNPPARN